MTSCRMSNHLPSTSPLPVREVHGSAATLRFTEHAQVPGPVSCHHPSGSGLNGRPHIGLIYHSFELFVVQLLSRSADPCPEASSQAPFRPPYLLLEISG